MTSPVTIVKLSVPTCQNTFGTSPCTATASAGMECFNGFSNCQDTENYTAGTKDYYFTHSDTEQEALDIVSEVMPSLKSISSVPTTLNIAGADSSLTGLGSRARLTLTFQDAPYQDLFTDPYVDTRDYDPQEQGTYWTKFLVRNPFMVNTEIKVYSGNAGDDIDDMEVQTYFWISNTYPTEAGIFTITGKDVLAYLEASASQIPALSSGELYEDIGADDDSLVVFGHDDGDYNASGTVRLNDEIMTYTGTTDTTEGLQLDGLTRGADNTTASDHSAEATVQRCVRFDQSTIYGAVEAILSEDYEGNIPNTYLDVSQWEEEINVNIPSYWVSEVISEPTPAATLISQISEQTLTYIWWEEREGKVKMRAVRGYSEEPDTLTEDSNIMAGFSITPLPDQRITQLWYYYSQEDQSVSDDEVSNYLRAYIKIDADKELGNQFNGSRTRTIQANWIKRTIFARDVSSRYMLRYSNTPRTATWSSDIKDRDYGVGDVIYIDHRLDVDQFGAKANSVWLITSYEVLARQGIVRYTAHDITAYGRNYYIMESGSPDYDPSEDRPFSASYIGDADGLLSDGTIGAIIS